MLKRTKVCLQAFPAGFSPKKPWDEPKLKTSKHVDKKDNFLSATKKRNKIIKPNKNSKTTTENATIKLLHVNAAGLKHKSEDLKNKVKYFQSSIVSVQETHYRKKGMFKLSNYKTFESIRKNKEKGGSLLLIHEDLNPVLVKEYNEYFELIVVEVSTEKETIRVMTGYGPQENWPENEIMPFWLAVEEEIAAAEIHGRSLIIQMDANAKLGSTYIKDDPYKISGNGKILAGILDRHAMIVINGLTNKCTGSITRQRTTTDNIEKSVIDYVIVSRDLGKHIKIMHIDEDRLNVLTKIVNKKSKGSKELVVLKESDHNTITAELKVEWTPNNNIKSMEVYKYHNMESLKTFKERTTNTKQLSSIFDSDTHLNVQTKKLLKRLKGFVAESFDQIK